MKKQYKETRRIFACDLRQLCIEKDWYTAGDNDDYGHLLLDLAEHKGNLTTADIIEIAEDIIEHSEMDSDCTIEDVAFEVARIANVSFEEAKDNIESSQKQLADAAAEKVSALEAKVKELEAHNHQMQETIGRLQRDNKATEGRQIMDIDLTRFIQLAEKDLAETEQLRDDSARRIVANAEIPSSEAFQQAVADHRNALADIEDKKDRLARLDVIKNAG